MYKMCIMAPIAHLLLGGTSFMAKKRLLITGTIAAVLIVTSSWGQRTQVGHITNPATVHLDGGSRVEFREFPSAALGETAYYSVFLPPHYDKDPDQLFPVIYTLHGMNNDHTTWTSHRYGNIPSLVEDILRSGDVPPFVMVHPYGENPFYTDYHDGSKKYEEFINQELITEIENKFRVKIDRLNRSIAGTSLGGYGALKIAMKNPALYSSVAVGSPIILMGEDPSKLISNSSARVARRFGGLFTQVFGTLFDQDHWRKNSIEVLANTVDLKNLGIYFAYGTEDRYQSYFPLEKGIKTVDRILTERNIPHIMQIYDGEPHGWMLLSNHMEEILGFLTQTFTGP